MGPGRTLSYCDGGIGVRNSEVHFEWIDSLRAHSDAVDGSLGSSSIQGFFSGADLPYDHGDLFLKPCCSNPRPGALRYHPLGDSFYLAPAEWNLFGSYDPGESERLTQTLEATKILLITSPNLAKELIDR